MRPYLDYLYMLLSVFYTQKLIHKNTSLAIIFQFLLITLHFFAMIVITTKDIPVQLFTYPQGVDKLCRALPFTRLLGHSCLYRL